jgi:large subunit ribosomal protein L6
MSRVGKNPVKVASTVKVSFAEGVFRAEGPKGKLSLKIPGGIVLKIEPSLIQVQLASEDQSTALQGTIRSQIQNIVTGVSEGFVRELDIVGVGYRAAVKGKILALTVGYSHPVDFDIPEGVTARVDSNTHVVLMGADKGQLGMVADKIRGVRPPEPYQGKGIRYTNEHIVRKAGKAAAGSK